MPLVPGDYLLTLERPEADHLVDCLYGEGVVLADVQEGRRVAPLLPRLALVYDSLHNGLLEEVIDDIAVVG